MIEGNTLPLEESLPFREAWAVHILDVEWDQVCWAKSMKLAFMEFGILSTSLALNSRGIYLNVLKLPTNNE